MKTGRAIDRGGRRSIGVDEGKKIRNRSVYHKRRRQIARKRRIGRGLRVRARGARRSRTGERSKYFGERTSLATAAKSAEDTPVPSDRLPSRERMIGAYGILRRWARCGSVPPSSASNQGRNQPSCLPDMVIWPSLPGAATPGAHAYFASVINVILLPPAQL